ncbi:MAG: sigma-70 family RNA polymerase sigma factor [Fimbriimonadia bacterium]|nr:sigma-70 family RNA polymerase sigma factor [Fimbriimonadia bacterium]
MTVANCRSDEAVQRYLQDRNDESLAQVIDSYESLLWSVVHKFVCPAGVEPADLYQTAVVGLIEGLRRVDPTRRGVNTYLYRYMWGAVSHYLRDHGSLIRVPANSPRLHYVQWEACVDRVAD